jgi:hypothetical protein
MDAAKLVFRDEMLKLGHDERVRNLYRINDKLSNAATFFIPNEPQDRFLRSRQGRDIVLKSRQIGFTTLSAIRGLDYALWEPNSKCGIMAHLQNTVTTIFNDIVKYSYNWFLRDWSSYYAPTEKASSKTELAFKDDGLGRPLESSMRVLFDFRGKTINFLHVSEAARVENPRLLGSLQGVPANGQVIYESTPQGRAGDFYQQWQNWKSLAALAPYRGHFVPWYEFYPEEPDRWHLPEEQALTAYERGLIENSNGKIAEAHIAWRRWCIAANCQGDPERFENEYPTNDIDAFFTGDSQVFPASTLKFQAKHVTPPRRVGFLISEGPGKTSLLEDTKGQIAIWEDPEVGHSYVMGADPSAGIGRDRGAAYVKCQQTGKVVGRLWGQLTPDDFAAELHKLGMYYNRAWICVESNNHGHVVIYALKQKHYPNLYKRRTLDDAGTPTTAVGFQTTNETKIVVTEKLKSSLKAGKMLVPDNDAINELSTFVQISGKSGKSVKREASSGAHDDLVMALALTEEMDLSRPVANGHNEPLTGTPTNDDGERYSIDPDTGFSAVG